MSNMENLDSSLANMSKNEMESKLINLKNQNIVYIKDIENYDQQLYELKHQLSAAKTRIENLSSELGSLQSTDISDKNKIMKKIEAREREIQVLKQENAENILSYEFKIHESKIKLQRLKENVETEDNKSTKDNTEKVQSTDTIFELKSKIEQLTLALDGNEYKYTEAMHKRGLLENMFSDLSNNVLELKDSINSTKEELKESSDLVHDLQDEIVVLHMELQQFRNASLDNDVKGNSLFAEVDDNRLKLKENVQIMNKNYMDIKTKYNNIRQELQKLHSEYASLTRIIENKKKLQESHCQLTESYKRHFNNLTENLKRLENEVELRNWANNKILSGEMKCAEDLISVTRKEVLNLQREVNSESLARTMSEQSLYETKREVRKWQTEAIQLRTRAVELNQTIEELNALQGLLECNEEADGPNIFTKKVEKEDDDENFINDYDDKIYSLFSAMTIDDNKQEQTSTTYLKTKEINVEENSVLPAKAITIKQENIALNCENIKIKEQSDNLADIKSEDNKENQCKAGTSMSAKSKCVNFSQNITESKTTDGTRKKIIAVPCVHISSLKNTNNK